MRNFLLILFIGIMISITSCRSDFDFEPSNGNLRFSKDTVYLDTVFTNIGSSTYTLKVYNKSDKNIAIPSIRLAKGDASKYRMTVDGMTGDDMNNDGFGDGKNFKSIELLAKDSLFIFIETTAGITDANPADFLYTDQIMFGAGANTQKVELVTLIQDAVFLFPQKFDDGSTDSLTVGETRVSGFFLDENDPIHGNEYELTNEKPYVIYGYAAVASGKTLNIAAGARLYFHAESGIIVASGGTLKINGLPSPVDDPEKNEVIFEGDRLEPGFSDTPGQWGTVWLTSESTGHTISHLTLKNAIIGLRIENNTGEMQISDTKIYNSSNIGIAATNANIKGNNIVINNAGQRTLQCLYGGKYNFTHCTFNNSWGGSSFAVLINNFIEGAEPQANSLVEANFNNCIIYGSNQIQMILEKEESAGFEYKFTNCLIKFNDTSHLFTDNPLYNFNDVSRFSGCLISKSGASVFDPDFLDVDKNKLIIGFDSAAKGKANYTFSSGTYDINGNLRIEPSDIGAYNFTVFEED